MEQESSSTGISKYGTSGPALGEACANGDEKLAKELYEKDPTVLNYQTMATSAEEQVLPILEDDDPMVIVATSDTGNLEIRVTSQLNPHLSTSLLQISLPRYEDLPPDIKRNPGRIYKAKDGSMVNGNIAATILLYISQRVERVADYVEGQEDETKAQSWRELAETARGVYELHAAKVLLSDSEAVQNTVLNKNTPLEPGCDQIYLDWLLTKEDQVFMESVPADEQYSRYLWMKKGCPREK